MDDDDRPSVRRVPASGVHVSITIGATSEHDLWSDVTMDVASGGVFVATYHPLAIGSVVHVLLTIEGDPTPLAMSGVVRWTRAHRDGGECPAGVGIRFVDLPAAAADKLARFALEVRQPMLFDLEDPPMRTRRGG